ncbi:hypothetical protein IX51_03405 [uncultured archaeon]|nr:hypothetical protein IX51_03405 [uncultured archaeon]
MQSAELSILDKLLLILPGVLGSLFINPWFSVEGNTPATTPNPVVLFRGSGQIRPPLMSENN